MAMNTPHSSSLRRPLRALCVLGLVLAAMAAPVGDAGAHVSPAQAEHAADRGVSWFLSNQEESGSFGFGGDWAMTALAAAGLNAADAKTSPLDPSAQDFYLGEWQVSGPGGAGTDAARGILSGIAGGIQPSRLSTDGDATKSNLVARLAELFDGTQIGEPGLLNDDIFGLLALHQAGAPRALLRQIAEYLRSKQLPDGGWTWNTSPGAPADTDMTGSAVAALCAAGIAPADPDLDRALSLLHALQDPATGGFVAPPESFGIGVNTDTTAWVTSGLVECGIDPQASAWTTAEGKTPLDYLVSMQRPDGHFDWTDEFAGGAFETYSSVRPLSGEAFSAAPPGRLDGVSPAVRPAMAVPTGTTVPLALAIDHGPGADDVRMCRIDAETGSSLSEVLAAAETASTPAGCVTEFETEPSGAGERLVSLNGVAATAGYGWRARIDDSAPAIEVGEPIGFGDLVFLDFEAKTADPGPAPAVEVPALRAAKQPRRRGPRISLRGPDRREGDRIALRLHCPRGNGELGCRGLLALRFRGGDGGLVGGGSAPFAVPSGDGRLVAVPISEALRDALARSPKVKLRIVAATRADDGSVRLTHGKRTVVG
jgi:Squalene-hopene cyclase N-terminal domain/Prenyltransferase and squalene oxidase repeat